MPTMGDLLAEARRSAGGFHTWLAENDAGMAHQVEVAASEMEVTVSTFFRIAVADFSRLAGEEDWATIVSSMRNSDVPGSICLLAILDWRLNMPTCENHSKIKQPSKGVADGAVD